MSVTPTLVRGAAEVETTTRGIRPHRRSGHLTLQVIRRKLRSLADRRAGDKNLHYLDGTILYGPADATELPLPDSLHPSTEAHHRIGTRFADYAFTGTGPFALRPGPRA